MLISQTDLPTNVTTLYTYDKAGRKIKVTNTKQKVEYQFGKSYNANTGLNNYGFRDYSSSIGRFITSAPIRDGTNWYTLAVNNPINFVDLWRLCTNDEKPKSTWENYTGTGNPYATQMINRDKSTSGTKNPYEGIEPTVKFCNLSRNNKEKILELDSKLWKQTSNFLSNINELLDEDVEITSALRTFEEQTELYQKGRNEELEIIDKDKIVTYAKAGQSNYNFGVAFDVAIYQNGKANWDYSSKECQMVVQEGVKQGLDAGANWEDFKDYPHFEDTDGKTTRQLYNEYIRRNNK